MTGSAKSGTHATPAPDYASLHPGYSGVICPMGYFVSSARVKNISLPRLVETPLWIPTVSSHRGAYRDRHGRGAGCGGRGSVLRATRSQGGSMRPVSDQQRADERCCSVRRSRVVLTPRRWRQVRGVKSAQPGLDKTYPLTTVAKEPGHKSTKETVKTIACGNAA